MPDPLYANSAYDFTLNATANGAPLDLTGATVTLILQAPNGTQTQHTAPVSSPATAGVAVYQGMPADLSTAGSWCKAWIVDFGDGRPRRRPGVPFHLETAP